MLILASFTDVVLNPIVNAATDFISSTGLPAVFLLMALESACILIPSEAVLLFSGATPAARIRMRRSCSSPASASPKVN